MSKKTDDILAGRLDDAELRALAGEPGSVGAFARGALQRREQERLALDTSGAPVVKGPTPEQLPAVRVALDEIRRNATQPLQIRIHNHYDPSVVLAALSDSEAGCAAVLRALELGGLARHAPRQAPRQAPPLPEPEIRAELAPPGRPDGFSQGRIDEIKATMLATGASRRGGR